MNFFQLYEAIESDKRLGKVVRQDVDAITKDWQRKQTAKRPEYTRYERITIESLYSTKRRIQEVALSIDKMGQNLKKWSDKVGQTMPGRLGSQMETVMSMFAPVHQHMQALYKEFNNVMMTVVPALQKKMDSASPGSSLEIKDRMTAGAHSFPSLGDLPVDDLKLASKAIMGELDNIAYTIRVNEDTGLKSAVEDTLGVLEKTSFGERFTESMKELFISFVQAFQQFNAYTYGVARQVYQQSPDMHRPTVSAPTANVPVPAGGTKAQIPTGMNKFSAGTGNSRPTIDFATPK